MKKNVLSVVTNSRTERGVMLYPRKASSARRVMTAALDTCGPFLVCILAMLCLLVMGSDGDYFPWVNFGALTVLVVIAIVSNNGRQSVL
jgi:uncharacterized RDD family membrane protein YckC